MNLQREDYVSFLKGTLAGLTVLIKIGPDFLGPSCPENQVNKEQFTQMRKEALSHPERILDFIRENPFSLSDDDLLLAQPLSRSVWDSFWIVKSTKNRLF